ncbi:ABC transporter ATP-binding protein [Spirilliplanes yamanashiensis]|uniref:ABC transporter domain-containing protein n=1 Tax=Spirilliplanes yamanashiensis TaxID=42233 RepID=A0A8J3YC63_9ACTN|nr:ABC transporter ATP-binding protein [Spirilliplanes yamanashiensis]MDP9818831.1 ABC-2 type transport system ATP-binding protein [Spirilliplanes yamanashiensis]GIJ05285.1 hypothetical protein Sya03_46370 [Spirilliplanes yamanashiensis]
MTDNVLTARDLRCRYGAFEAVRGAGFTVRRGELLCLLGTNGAGKTTVLDVLRGHRRPTGGAVRVLGLDPARHRRRLAPAVGVVPQDPGFAGALTVAETCELWVRLRGLRPDAGAPAEVGLDHRLTVPVRQLSGGERRRLDLAIALAGHPAALLLDEPTAGLDPQSRERAWELIRARCAAGAAVLLTTHALDEVEALADRIVLLRAGRVVAAGTPAEVTAGRPHRIVCAVPARLRDRPPPALAGAVAWRATAGPGAELTVTTPAPAADLDALRAWAAPAGLARVAVTPPSVGDLLREVPA